MCSSDLCAVAVLTPIGLARIFAGDLPTLPPSHAPYGGHYVYSSGTTGRFKKIYYDAAREEPRAAARRAALSLPPGNVHHAMRTALWTGNGWKAPLAHWWHGGTVIFEQREGGAFDFMAEQEFGSITLAPPMLKQLLARADAAVIRNPDCRVFSGFGLVSKTLIQDLRTRLRRRFVRNYSCSELAVPSLLSAIDGAEDLDWYAPTPGKRVQIVDESGAPLPPGTQGEVRIALTELDASGYADDRQASARAFRDGFFHPGDLGVMRADGRVSILGRAADVLVVQGRKVPVAPFEQDLQRMFDGAEVCVFSHLNAKGDEELVIAIESATRPSAPKLQDAVRMFTEFGQVRFVMRSQFPRTDDTARKVRRAALKALLAS